MKRIFGKLMNRTVVAVLVLLPLCFCACDSAHKEFEYLSLPFTAEVSGDVDGVAVSAEVFCDPTEHKTKEIYNWMTVKFSAPESLEGIVVTLRSDGRATIRLNGAEEELPLYSGFAEPYLALCCGGEIASRRKTEEGYEIVFSEGENSVILALDDKKVPVGVRGDVNGRNLSLKVIKFQQTQK